jgi:hypothetical protein
MRRGRRIHPTATRLRRYAHAPDRIVPAENVAGGHSSSFSSSHGEAEFSDDEKTCLAFAGSHTDITSYKDEHELHEEILSMLPALVFMKDELHEGS